MPERTSTSEFQKSWYLGAHFHVLVELLGPYARIWCYPRSSLLHICHFDPGPLPALGLEGEGEADVLVTGLSDSGRPLKLHPKVVSPKGAGRPGVETEPLPE